MSRKLRIGPLARNLAGTAGVQAAVALLSLISGPLQARGLGPDGRGQVAVVLVIGQISAFLSDAGTLGYIIRERARGRAAGELIGSIFPIVALSTVVWWIAAFPLAESFGRGNSTLSLLIMVQLMLLPFNAITQVGSGIALGDERWRIVATIRLAVAIVPVVGALGLFFSGYMTVEAVCIFYFVATIIASVPAVWVCIKARPFVYKASVFGESWSFGRVAMLSVIVTVANTRADVLIVSQYLSLSDAGLYAVASSLAAVPLMLTNSAAQSLSRRLTLNSLGSETARACRVLSMVILIGAAVIAASAPVVLPLIFGVAFSKSVPILWILLVGTVFGSYSSFLTYATSLSGQPKNAALSQFFGVVAMVVSMAALMPVFGLAGAAFSSALGYAVSALALLYNAQRTSGTRWYYFVLPNYTDFKELVSLIVSK